MSKNITLKAEKRAEDKNARQVRQLGLLPATIYGKGMDSVSIQLEAKSFILGYKKNPDAVYSIAVNKDSYNAKVANIQMNYSTGQELNVEFQLV